MRRWGAYLGLLVLLAPGLERCALPPACDDRYRVDDANCGGCGIVCATTRPHAWSRCGYDDGPSGAPALRCAEGCDDGFGDCDGDPANGCETEAAWPEACPCPAGRWACSRRGCHLGPSVACVESLGECYFVQCD